MAPKSGVSKPGVPKRLAFQSALADQRWIIFCKVVDYFGDAGFCWRLASALKRMGVGHVLLVIDRLTVLDDLRGRERVPGVEALPWNVVQDAWTQTGVPVEHRADVVIEAFACEPPDAYIQNLSPAARWISLDYLATEPWADEAQGRSSPVPRLAHPAAQARRWCVPGFSQQTAGLLHGSWRHLQADERRAWRAQLAGKPIDDRVTLIMAFGYDDAPWAELSQALSGQPGSDSFNAPAAVLPAGYDAVEFWKPQGLELSQAEFDCALQACDLNFVRGEDSFVRAHWAAAGPWRVPFVWQPYRQPEKAHGHKLAGWMSQVLKPVSLGPLERFHWAWNGLAPVERPELLMPGGLATPWAELVLGWPEIRQALHRQCLRLAAAPGLEQKLVQFVRDWLK